MLDLLYQYYSGQYKLIEQLHLINHVQGLPLISLLSYSSSLPEKRLLRAEHMVRILLTMF